MSTHRNMLFSQNEAKSNIRRDKSCKKAKGNWKEVKNLFRKGATRQIRRSVRYRFFATPYSVSEITSYVDRKNNRLIDRLVNAIEEPRKQARIQSLLEEKRKLSGEPVFHLPTMDHYVLLNRIGRSSYQDYESKPSSTPPAKTPDTAAVKPEDTRVSLGEPVPSPVLVQAVKKEEPNFIRMNGVFRQLGYNTLVARTETGIELPFAQWDEYVQMCYTRNTVLPLGFSKNGPIIGGYKGKKGKKKGNRKKRRGVKNIGKMHMDCSPGNVYESSALMVTDATGALNIVIALNNPQQIFQGVTATGAQDLANNWDAYSVERVSMSTQIRAPINARQGEWNLVCDHDSSPPTTAITQNLLLTYTSKRSYSSQAAPRWSVVPRKLSQCEYISAPAADPEPAVIVQKGKYDWNTPPSNGFMYVKLIGGPASTNIGTIYVRVHVTAWYKRRLAIAMEPIANVPLLQEEESESSSDEKVIKKRVRGNTTK